MIQEVSRKPSLKPLRFLRRFIICAALPYLIYCISQSTIECLLVWSRGEWAFACGPQAWVGYWNWGFTLALFIGAVAVEIDHYRKRETIPRDVPRRWFF